MALWYGYIGIENLALNDNQRGLLVEKLLTLGQANGAAPNFRMQLRARLDNQAAIFEAVFDDSNLTPTAVKGYLGTIFSVSPGTISHAIVTAPFGLGTTQVATFTRTGTDYLRVAVFGGVTSTWEESRKEVQAYLRQNAAAWGEEVV